MTIRFHPSPLPGMQAMSADTARSFPRHTHDQFGIGVLDRGAQVSRSDSRQVQATPGDLIFVNPGEVHDGRAAGGQPRAWRMLYLDPMLLHGARVDVLQSCGNGYSFPQPVASNTLIRRLFNALHAQIVSSPGVLDDMACESLLLRLAAGLEVGLARRPLPRIDFGPVDRVRQRIHDEPAAEFTLQDLASAAGMSRFQLHRGFVGKFNLAPHAYILQQRLALARRLLQRGEPVAHVALAAGFSDQSHLSRWFTKVYGVPPARYARTFR